MADVTRTIGPTTGESSTIGAAITWLQSNYTQGTDDIGHLKIVDAANYNEEISISGISGTASATSYVWLYADTGVRHSGVAGTGHARMVGSLSTQNRYIEIGENFAKVSHLEIYQQSTQVSDEAIRILSGYVGVVIDSMILHSDVVDDQDAIYTGNYNVGSATNPIRVQNCLIYDWYRAAINNQDYSGAHDTYWEIYYCTNENTGTDGGESGFSMYPQSSFSTANAEVYNCYSDDPVNATRKAYDETGDGTVNWSGSNNLAGDDSAVAKFTSSHDNVTITDNNSASGEVYTVASLSGNDYTSEENDGTGTDRLYQGGTSVSGVTLDIAGNTRHATTPCIGCFEIAAAGGAFPYHSVKQQRKDIKTLLTM